MDYLKKCINYTSKKANSINKENEEEDIDEMLQDPVTKNEED